MIYVTGDTHGGIDMSKLNTKRFPQQKDMTKDDYLIICGDFGLCWDGSNEEKFWLKWLSDKNFTTLWIDGNHENFDMLYQIPLIDKFGGKVREIAKDIYHLGRGQVLTIDGKRFFVMGGARSVDKEYRVEHVSWWEQEIPSIEEMKRAIDTLERSNWGVDYVITHCAPRSIQEQIESWYENDPMVSFLDIVRCDLSFEKWYFGHYHVDKQIGERFVALYNNVVKVI